MQLNDRFKSNQDFIIFCPSPAKMRLLRKRVQQSPAKLGVHPKVATQSFLNSIGSRIAPVRSLFRERSEKSGDQIWRLRAPTCNVRSCNNISLTLQLTNKSLNRTKSVLMDGYHMIPMIISTAGALVAIHNSLRGIHSPTPLTLFATTCLSPFH